MLRQSRYLRRPERSRPSAARRSALHITQPSENAGINHELQTHRVAVEVIEKARILGQHEVLGFPPEGMAPPDAAAGVAPPHLPVMVAFFSNHPWCCGSSRSLSCGCNRTVLIGRRRSDCTTFCSKLRSHLF